MLFLKSTAAIEHVTATQTGQSCQPLLKQSYFNFNMYLSLLYNCSQQLGLVYKHFLQCIISAQIANNTVSQKSTHLNHQLRQASNCPRQQTVRAGCLKDMLEFKTFFQALLQLFEFLFIFLGNVWRSLTVSLNGKINC